MVGLIVSAMRLSRTWEEAFWRASAGRAVPRHLAYQRPGATAPAAGGVVA